MPGQRLHWLPLALLALILITLFHRLLLGEVLFWGLPALQFYPWREFALSELQAGRLPLWSPYNGAGAPLMANYQSAALYPPNWLHLLFPGPHLMGVLGVLHLFWAGVGMWVLAGRLSLPLLGRMIATLAFPLSTTLVARFGTVPMIDAAAWLPWLALTVDALVVRPGLGAFLALSAAAAMQLLAGHAQWTFYSLIFVSGYALWRVIIERRSALRLLAAALALVLGAGIAAAQLVPTAELQRLSQRADSLDEAFALNFSLPPVALVTLFNPDFFGNPGDGSYAIGGAAFEIAAYAGILTIVLAGIGTLHALFGLLRRWLRSGRSIPTAQPDSPRHLVGFFALVVAITLIFALGYHLPVYPFLYRHVPTFSLFQAPARWLLLTVFALTMLAAFATTNWQPGAHTLRVSRLTMAGAGGIVLVSLIGQRLIPEIPPIATQLAQGAAGLGVLVFVVALIFAAQPKAGSSRRQVMWLIGVTAFLCADLWWANSRSNPTTSADFYAPDASRRQQNNTGRTFWTEVEFNRVAFDELLPFNDYRLAVARRDALRHSGLPNLNLLDRQPSLNNFDPLRPVWVERFIDLLSSAARPALFRAGAVSRAFGVEMTPQPAPRLWIVADAKPVESAEAAEQAMRSNDWDAASVAVLEVTGSVTGGMTELTKAVSSAPGTATLRAEHPQELIIAVDSPGGWLVVADAYYPGWGAEIDGQPVPIYRANLAFRAVSIPPGQHLVRMYYQPLSVYLGLLITAASLVVFGLLALIAARKRFSAAKSVNK